MHISDGSERWARYKSAYSSAHSAAHRSANPSAGARQSHRHHANSSTGFESPPHQCDVLDADYQLIGTRTAPIAADNGLAPHTTGVDNQSKIRRTDNAHTSLAKLYQAYNCAPSDLGGRFVDCRV